MWSVSARNPYARRKLIELAEEAGFRVNCPKDSGRRGGTVAIDVLDAEEVTRELARREVLADYRPGAGIRVAPHFYTKDEELELTIREIGHIVARQPARV